jgi:leucyl-tRNA synthetase
MIDQGDAVTYYEPGGYVVSRSGEECVVKCWNQWYINYSDQTWKERVLVYVEKKLKCSSESLRK